MEGVIIIMEIIIALRVGDWADFMSSVWCRALRACSFADVPRSLRTCVGCGDLMLHHFARFTDRLWKLWPHQLEMG